MKIKFIRYCILLVLTLQMPSCDDNFVSSIPDYPVNLNLNLTSTYPNFNGPNQFQLFEKPIFATDRIGFGGIIVYIGLDNNYYAFDMACPYETKRSILVFPDTTGLPQVICKTCGSIYDLSYGIANPTLGPSKEVLKRYKAIKSGDYLYITQ